MKALFGWVQGPDTVHATASWLGSGCSEGHPTSITGLIELVHRGECSFAQKALRAQERGAVALVVVDILGDSLFAMGATDQEALSIYVPTVMTTSAYFSTSVNEGVNVTISMIRDSQSASSPTTPTSMINTAELLAREQRYGDAMLQLEFATTLFPADVNLWLRRLWLNQDLCSWNTTDVIEQVRIVDKLICWIYKQSP
jgi:hypothetical protein